MILDCANFNIDICRTRYYKHAYDHVLNLDPNRYDTIITCSGDGIVHEVINGIMNHKSRNDFISRVALGIIPGGTSNGFSKAICESSGEACNPENAAFIVAKGYVKDVDIMEIETVDGNKTFSFLSLAWGIIADIDLDSERYNIVKIVYVF